MRKGYLALIVAISFYAGICAEGRKDKPRTRSLLTPLVDVSQVHPGIRFDLVLATDRNFTGQILYEESKCYVLPEVARRLKKVQKELEKKDLGLLIWDAYRPWSVQKRLWDVCPDPRYVSDLRLGGRHTRGTAVDVTLYRLIDGKLLEMPTDVDDFSEKAWRDCEDLPEHVKANRRFLQDIMEKHGFIGLPTEWWHFDLDGWEEYPVLDISFELLG